MKTRSSYLVDIPRILNNSLQDNLDWGMEVINDSLRYLTTKYYFNERSYTISSVANQQFYNLPPQIKKLINVTVNIGGVLWQPKECPSREYWDYLNTITFSQAFPSYFFVYNGQVGIWPTTSNTGDTITMNYKTRIIDLSQADVTNTSSGTTVNVTTLTPTITAVASAFVNWMAGNWIRIPFSSTNSTSGDNQWYQIATVATSTSITLKNNYTGSTVTGGAFTVGETPILPEDYQDLPLYRLGVIYYTTRFPDPIRAQQYQSLWDVGEAKLNDEFGSKSTNVVLNDTTDAIINPNLFTSRVN